jgi:antirestriction protein ArdC
MRFRLSSVFEVSQTEPLPDVKPAPLEAPRQPVEGDSHVHLLAPLEVFAAEIGYPVQRVQDLGGPEAHCHHGEKAIRLVDAFPANHQVAALIHELAHALQGPRPRAEYAHNEVIVESVAFIVTQCIGLDTTTAAIPYINSWGGEDAMANVREAVAQIDAIAGQLQAVLEQVDQDDEQHTDRKAPDASEAALQAA